MSALAADGALDATEARVLTDRIRVAVDGTWQLIRDAYLGRVWIALGYASWDDYTHQEFGSARLRLPQEERRESVASLRDAGLSLRAIETGLDISRTTVIKDLRERQVVQSAPPAPVESRQAWDAVAEAAGAPSTHTWDVPAWAEPASEGAPVITPKPITGLDGKTYPTAPTPATPRRRALTDQARDAGWELRKAVERLERIRGDDRFARNKEEVASQLRGHLQNAVQVCQDLLDDINN